MINTDIDKIIELYNSGMSLKQVGELCKMSQQSIRRRLAHAGVSLRTYTSNQKGENNHNFKGGDSRSTIRRICKQVLIDNNISQYICQKCGNEFYQNLNVHHIDNNRLNNDISNLLVLCAGCHALQHPKSRTELGRFA